MWSTVCELITARAAELTEDNIPVWYLEAFAKELEKASAFAAAKIIRVAIKQWETDLKEAKDEDENA